jgi:hypothetical protein
MGRKRMHTPEEIAAKLRQAKVLVAGGKSVVEAVRALGGERGDVSPVAGRVWWAEAGRGEAAEGFGALPRTSGRTRG